MRRRIDESDEAHFAVAEPISAIDDGKVGRAGKSQYTLDDEKSWDVKNPGPCANLRFAAGRAAPVAARAEFLKHKGERHGARTGAPLVLNTSFNDSEPIVCTPARAIATFRGAGRDALVIGDCCLVSEG